MKIDWQVIRNGLLFLTLMVAMVGIAIVSENKFERRQPDAKKSKEEDEGRSGVGMTIGGKIGVDLGGGLVLPFDGSGISIGYGL